MAVRDEQGKSVMESVLVTEAVGDFLKGLWGPVQRARQMRPLEI
jgi:hypothetical protein